MGAQTLTAAAEVRAARRKLGLTQGQFALKLGLKLWSGRVMVARWEAGKHKPQAGTMQLIRVLVEMAKEGKS